MPSFVDNACNVSFNQTRLSTAWESVTGASKQISVARFSSEDRNQLKSHPSATNSPRDVPDSAFSNQASTPFNTPLSTVAISNQNFGFTPHPASLFHVDLSSYPEMSFGSVALEEEPAPPYGVMPFPIRYYSPVRRTGVPHLSVCRTHDRDIVKRKRHNLERSLTC